MRQGFGVRSHRWKHGTRAAQSVQNLQKDRDQVLAPCCAIEAGPAHILLEFLSSPIGRGYTSGAGGTARFRIFGRAGDEPELNPHHLKTGVGTTSQF